MENVQNGFGLTQHQLELLHNMQIKKTEADIMAEKNCEKRALKEKWLKLWVKSLKDGIDNNSGKDAFNKYSALITLNNAIREEISADSNNLVWYYISIIECELFIPYFPLGNTEEDKNLKKIKYTQKNFTEEFVNAHGVVTGEYIQRISKQYKKIIDKLDKKTMKLAMAVISTAAITALTFGVATYFAPAIAVALVGESFAGLSGIALTNACLAMLGGGAIEAGGAGIAGGIAAIAGGGSIFGFTIGGTAAAATTAVFWNPEYAITNIAKFELVIKEVFLNVQHDVKYSQECIAAYKAKIREMEDYIEELQRNEKENKKEIKNLAKTLSYMQSAYIELNKFCSVFDIGMQYTEG
ncbi:hypothetical protein FMM68_05990 [Lachnospiraceae bacterium MD329]|nr:hypothetical protein [Lachnospiraceae bacterium MD329]